MSSRIRILWLALLGIVLLAVGLLPVFYLRCEWPGIAQEKQAPLIQKAGGSATGNALELAADTQRAEPWLVVIDSGSRLAIPATSASLRITETPADSTVPDPNPDSLGRPLAPDELTRWISSRQLPHRRLFVLSPTGDNTQARPGPAGPAYQDLSCLPGGLQSGDLVVYREGIYNSALQFPPKSFQADADAPLLLLAWPGEHARLASASLLPGDSAQYWKIIGLEWSALANQGAKR